MTIRERKRILSSAPPLSPDIPERRVSAFFPSVSERASLHREGQSSLAGQARRPRLVLPRTALAGSTQVGKAGCPAEPSKADRPAMGGLFGDGPAIGRKAEGRVTGKRFQQWKLLLDHAQGVAVSVSPSFGLADMRIVSLTGRRRLGQPRRRLSVVWAPEELKLFQETKSRRQQKSRRKTGGQTSLLGGAGSPVDFRRVRWRRPSDPCRGDPARSRKSPADHR